MNYLHQHIGPNIILLLTGLFLITLIIQLYFILNIHRRLAFFKSTKSEEQINIPISVIISARNESDNLYKNLPKILEQKYSLFEVIVVNHQSIDNSKEILEAFSKQYKNLKVVELAKTKHISTGKKLPLTIGIKAAQYEHLIFTDADCEPNSHQWIKNMATQ